ncbi:RsmB/NOP family class I SAM-dependent RNA methyltransferase [Paenibacillus sp. ACRRX]|uniref:RsmB/NOP family class I SAM-dependent RNA methyltransferase n=1 Tax=unclassified Paenibacillus TaxID=185978 RepID=UPI001EF5BEA9|nr:MULTISPECIES: RsmB/NOP family class I SAM-dependent RNA methyltransferase [unclassified Paenibacillus]MCG7406073.1 RsmB/NOP family class I SAM-dependent RNA methyltransferase [Paenibacillus sp. ACRRX]MDK8182527.1 RsmB/NOP family class I SAM-dependent RNA methyltransferase [Paenibacillus sp. UMB4589-SE434]
MYQLKQQLPDLYRQQMTAILQEDAAAFFASYEQPRTYGLRVHPDKWVLHDTARQQALQQFGLAPVAWCSEGYTYLDQARPGRHPYHAAGLYYIQEPSAMSAVALLDPQPGETILDLAAAPGGKSTQIAGRMQGKGLLVSNEIHRERARILAGNVERMGMANVVVVNADPDSLATRFPEVFDRIMLDAPCSGEGMFRKDPDAIDEWSPDHVQMCAARQWDIVQAAVRMLKPGGTIAYSTCTFNEQENEQLIARWIQAYPQFRVIKTERIWPHLHTGEGHFVAVLRLEEPLQHIAAASSTLSCVPAPSSKQQKGKASKHNGDSRARQEAEAAYRAFQEWAQVNLTQWTPGPGEAILYGEELYWLPHPINNANLKLSPDFLSGLRVPRPGLHLAHMRKNRVEPAHALALSLQSAACVNSVWELPSGSNQVKAYLRGETITAEPGEETACCKGWTLVTTDGLPLGWGKVSDGILKNHYPKGLRTP